MATPIQITSDTVVKLLVRRGLDSDRVNTILTSGELGYTTDTKRLFVGDGGALGGTLGGILVGNKNNIADLGKENVASPLPGDIVYETYDSNGNASNILYALNQSSSWVNIHPQYSQTFSYNGALDFNSQYLKLDAATGNFGIGTSTPSARLDVKGSGSFDGGVNVTGDIDAQRAFIRSQPTTGLEGTNKAYVDGKFLPVSALDTLIKPYVHTNFVTITGDVMRGVLNTGGYPLVLSALPTSPIHSANKQYVDVLVAATSGSTLGFVDSKYLPITGGTLTGPLTSSPDSNGPAVTIRQTGDGFALQVDDIVRGTNPFIIDNYGSVGIGGAPVYNGGTQLTVFGTASATQTVFSNDFIANNSVGVKTTSPLVSMHVAGALRLDSENVPPIGSEDPANLTNTYLVLGPGNSISDWSYIRQVGGNDYYTLAIDLHDNPNSLTTGQAFAIRNVGSSVNPDQVSTRFLIDGTGNVGVNSTAPSHRLTVNGDIALESNNTSLFFRDTAGTRPSFTVSTSNDFIFNSTNASGGNRSIWRVNQRNSSSPFLIDVPTTVSGNLTVNGAIFATGDVTAYTTSDRRLKDNIKPISSALTKLDRINGVEFDWNSELQSNYTGHDIGVLAQEIEEIIPEAVITREDGYKAVRYEKVIPLLLQAVKELKDIVLANAK